MGSPSLTVQDAQAIQSDVPGEGSPGAGRSGRTGQTFEAAMKQPALLDNANRPTLEPSPLPVRQQSAVMVTVQPGMEIDEVAAIIAGWSDVSVFTQEESAELLLKGSVEKIKARSDCFVLLTIIAAIIMVLILYTLTLDKIHSIALPAGSEPRNHVILG